ncbi:MAG: response regulator [Ardenticatenaceae bacterium]|nr:response regulator [Ardenticatenaceae bacterium]MCB9444366.1 response regulator [Ardenticatenaceae bacterium]
MNMKILIAEDSPTEALKAKLILEKQGYQVSRAVDGQEALQMAAVEKPDLIVMDTIMPRMTGYEAYQHIKANPQTGDIPVLMLMTNNGATVQPQPLGADMYIAKPYSPALLLEGVQAVRSRKNGYSDNFLAIMSHELRTPLHELVGMTDLLETTKLSAEQQQYVNKAKISINALSVMVSDLLEFSELEAGQLDLHEQSFDWAELVENTAVLLQSRAEEKGLNLSWQIDKAAPRNVVGDPKRLRQVLGNLLANAVKFTEKGQVDVTVTRIGGSDEAVSLHFVVRDTGVGIPPEKQHLIFEAFQQSDTTHTRNYGGIGLGLAVANQLVVLMGGNLQVASSGIPGEGSVFQFDLLLPLDKTAVTLPEPPKIVESPSLQVLLAEDSPTNQLIATANLKKAGHEVTVAENGRVAVEALTKREFDLVLMDVAMPEMDGLEATIAIRKMEANAGNGRHIPIIAMTAFAMQGYREKCLAAGMDGYVSKPISADELHKALEPFLERFQNGQNGRQKVGETAVSLTKALEIVDHDLDILEMVVEMFPQEYPSLLAALNEALAAGNGRDLEAPAHRLKAVLGSVGSGPAFALAAQLETMGMEGIVEGGTAVYQQLQTEIQHIVDFYGQSNWMTAAAAILGDRDG